MKKHINKIAIVTSIIVVGLFSAAFTDSYFEVSKNLDIFATLFKEVNMKYVDDTSPGKLMKTGIDAMLKSLDPYTNYIPESDIEDYRFMTTGQYGGIGSLIRKRGDYVMIAEPYENSPAHKAGLLAGDIVLEVNGVSAKNKNTEDLSKVLKGEPNTEVVLKIKRDDQELEKKLIREDIKLDDVPYYGMLDEKTGYIKLTSFTKTAAKQVTAAFEDLKGKGMSSLVFDLRDNGGGLLDQAIKIVNIFVDRGQEVVSTKGKVKNWDKSYKTEAAAIDKEIPVIVLINENSASASEIVSGTLQDLDRGVLIGNKSYGKGLVQQTVPLSYNSQLKVTVAKYYTPSGRCIQRINYSDKDNKGKAKAIPDSLIKEFKTKNGRSVFDGEGITPDIEVEELESHEILYSLVSENLLFDFATEYKKNHDSLPAPDAFHLSNEEYNSFVKFTEGKKYEYETESERIIDDLVEVAKIEKYDNLSDEIATLKEKLKKNKENDINNFKEEIQMVLENEIVSRYYFQKGRIRASLSVDPDIEKSLELFNNKETYNSILTGTNTK